MIRAYRPQSSRFWLLAALLLVAAGAGPARPARAEPACPATRPSGGRYVVWVPGFLSSSLTGQQPGSLDPGNHQVRDEAAAIREALTAALSDAPRLVYFSYGVAPLASAGEPPERAWLGDSYFDGHEPRYWPQDTSNYPVQPHADALDWLLRGLLRCDPEATVDVLGYSLGGLVALCWAATADAAPNAPLAAVHRVIVIDSPVGGINPGILGSAMAAAPPDARAAFGTGAVLADLLSAGDVIRSLPGAIGRVDVASVENSRDYLVNGAALPAAASTGPDGWLARGAAITFLPPDRHPDSYYADMGLGVPPGPTVWDYVVGIHGAILTHPAALQRLVELVRSDGPLWQARSGAPALTPETVAP